MDDSRKELLEQRRFDYKRHHMDLVRGGFMDADCKHMCAECINFYKEEHDGIFYPQCRLSADIAIEKELELVKDLRIDEKEALKVIRSPVQWSDLYFGWQARWYQDHMLRCTARLKVYRCGRRVGKSTALGVEGIHAASTNKNFTVLVICPYQDQVALLFNKIREILYESPDLAASVVSDRRNPQAIEFSNGSKIFGVTAAVKTGGKADKIRGQDADLIILDEMDYLDEDSLDSILAILGTNANVRLVASSTPSGRHALFRDWCLNKKIGFKEFFFPATVNPAWGPVLEEFFRNSLSEIGYIHEVLAEFGEQETGVYQHQYIEDSLREYTYKNLARNSNPRYLYTMGVDWNSTGQGTHFVICEYDPSTEEKTGQGIIRTVLREQINPTEFTQLAGVERIKQLAEIWKPDFIYVDAGFGSTQIELLHEYGMRNPRTKLHKIVKSIDMGSKTLIRDPMGELIKKPTKALMVEISARRLEVGQCEFPVDEDMKIGLVGQMREFRVERYGRDGQPIYTQGNDHALTAWQLAVFALVMEFTRLAKPVVTNRVIFTNFHGKAVKTHKELIKDRTDKAPVPRLIREKEDFQVTSGLNSLFTQRDGRKRAEKISRDMAATRKPFNRKNIGRKKF